MLRDNIVAPMRQIMRQKKVSYCTYDGNECLGSFVQRHDKICGRRVKSSFGSQSSFKAILRHELWQKNDKLPGKAHLHHEFLQIAQSSVITFYKIGYQFPQSELSNGAFSFSRWVYYCLAKYRIPQMYSYIILGLRPTESLKARKELVIRCTKYLSLAQNNGS